MFPKLEGEIAPRMKFRGKEVLTWSLNNYLGLANHPEVRKADADGAAEWGLATPMGARMMSGNTSLHEKLEKELAEYKGKFTANETFQWANFEALKAVESNQLKIIERRENSENL